MSGSPIGRSSGRDPPTTADTRKHKAKIRNERLKLGAAAFDHASTVMLGGGVLSPLFQNGPLRWTALLWLLGAVVLHMAGQFVLGFIEEER